MRPVRHYIPRRSAAVFFLAWAVAPFLILGKRKAQPIFVDCALLGGNCSMNFFTKSLLLEIPQENLIRCLQGFVILAVSGAKSLHCGDEYIVIAALPLELL